MGNSFSSAKTGCCVKGVSDVFTDEELDEYADVTYFTKREIVKLHMVFEQLVGPLKKLTKTTRVPREDIMAHKYLKCNPFSDRIVQVFSKRRDGSYTFDDFVDMMNVFHADAPASLKAHYAFQIYDFNADNEISDEDLEVLTNRLISSEEDIMYLTREEMDIFIQEVLNEVSLYNDETVSYVEFMHGISKSIKFKKRFCISI